MAEFRARVEYASDLRRSWAGDTLEPSASYDTVVVWEGTVTAPTPPAACEVLFERFNIGDHGGQGGIRSMCGGDVVVIDGVRYLCCTIGWKVVERGE